MIYRIICEITGRALSAPSEASVRLAGGGEREVA